MLTDIGVRNDDGGYESRGLPYTRAARIGLFMQLLSVGVGASIMASRGRQSRPGKGCGAAGPGKRSMDDDRGEHPEGSDITPGSTLETDAQYRMLSAALNPQSGQCRQNMAVMGYIATMVAELAGVARANGFGTLAYLLDMARMEAEQGSERRP